MNKILNWFKASLEGTDGKSSSKALTLLWAVILVTALHIAFMYIGIRVAERAVPTEASLKVMDRLRDLIGIDWTVMLILFGVVTIQTLIQAFKAFRGQPTDPIFTETSTSTTTKEIKPKSNEEIILPSSTHSINVTNG
jgi:hypothetical protein